MEVLSRRTTYNAHPVLLKELHEVAATRTERRQHVQVTSPRRLRARVDVSQSMAHNCRVRRNWSSCDPIPRHLNASRQLF